MIFSKLKVPIIVSPMASISNSSFVNSICRSGALGSFGFAYTSPQNILKQINEVKKFNFSCNANFFIFQSIDNYNQSEIWNNKLKSLQKILPSNYSNQISSQLISEPYFPNLNDQLEAIWETKPEFLSFHFGIPSETIIEKAKKLGIKIGMTATCLNEVNQIVEMGGDYVVLQGIEAGGHRGTFIENDSNDEKLSTFELLKVVKLTNLSNKIALVASGGIMNAQQIKDALLLGANAVQLGTLFIPSKESSASLEYKNAILGNYSNSSSKLFPSSILTSQWSGRLARCISNQYTQITEFNSPAFLPFPIQNTITQKIREKAKINKDVNFQSMYVGMNYSQTCELLSNTKNSHWETEETLPTAEEIMNKLIKQLNQIH